MGSSGALIPACSQHCRRCTGNHRQTCSRHRSARHFRVGGVGPTGGRALCGKILDSYQGLRFKGCPRKKICGSSKCQMCSDIWSGDFEWPWTKTSNFLARKVQEPTLYSFYKLRIARYCQSSCEFSISSSQPSQLRPLQCILPSLRRSTMTVFPTLRASDISAPVLGCSNQAFVWTATAKRA